ncbi:MAG TPA: NAD(P)-binding oxidoreductase [Spirochaetia bacterium]|nr:NAD(P)-binding oxidoreductase [Spirochaetia bacterium]
MRLAVFGATGGIGQCLVEQALTKGHTVTAPVRNPAKMTTTHARLRVIPCDALDPVCVSAAVEDHDVVLCALGVGVQQRTTFFSASTRNIVTAMEDKSVRRLIFVSNYCVLSETPRDVFGKTMLFLTRMYLRNVLPDQRQALEEVRQSHLEWVVVRPLALTNAPAQGAYRIALDGLPPRGRQISRADVAEFMLSQLTSRQYLRMIPALAY